jgi:UDP-GlcNAc3NAcA epimerase
MKIVSIVGTRPNFIKEYVMFPQFQARGIEEVLVHTGQHFDYEMSELFFEQLEIPRPHYMNEVIKGKHGRETGEMMGFIESVLMDEQPDATLVYGDVNSTMAAALASAKLRIPVVHIEAGLRTPFRYNPEEINRRVADTVSDLLFPHIREAYESLMREGYDPADVFLPGDIMKDSLLKITEKYGIEPTKGDYCVATVHRAENTEDPKRLEAILDGFLTSHIPIKFAVHPRTSKRMAQLGLIKKIEQSKVVELLPPIGYLDFMRLMAGADRVLTDSGGVRREAYILGKPVVNLTNIVWVPEMVSCGWSLIADADSKKIADAIRNHNPSGERPEIFGDGHAAERIAEIIEKRYGK